MLAGTECMNDLAECFLADSALSGDQYCQIGGSNSYCCIKCPVKYFRSSDEAKPLFDAGCIHDIIISGAMMLPLRVALVACSTSTCTDRKSTRLNSSHLVISYAV